MAEWLSDLFLSVVELEVVCKIQTYLDRLCMLSKYVSLVLQKRSCLVGWFQVFYWRGILSRRVDLNYSSPATFYTSMWFQGLFHVLSSDYIVVFIHISSNMRLHWSRFPVTNVFTSLRIRKIVAESDYTSPFSDLWKTQYQGPVVVAPCVVWSYVNLVD